MAKGSILDALNEKFGVKGKSIVDALNKKNGTNHNTISDAINDLSLSGGVIVVDELPTEEQKSNTLYAIDNEGKFDYYVYDIRTGWGKVLSTNNYYVYVNDDVQLAGPIMDEKTNGIQFRQLANGKNVVANLDNSGATLLLVIGGLTSSDLAISGKAVVYGTEYIEVRGNCTISRAVSEPEGE